MRWPLDGIEGYAAVIRDDYSKPSRIPVPIPIAAKDGVYLQSIKIPRKILPCGYLHHRLVPIVVGDRLPYASIIPHRYWGEEFRALWCSEDPPLSDEMLSDFRSDSPEITP